MVAQEEQILAAGLPDIEVEGEANIEGTVVDPNRPPLPIEETNLAENMDEAELDLIAKKVIDDYKNDLDSREEWEEMHAEWLELFYQSDVQENPPWDNASTESIPVFTEAINQFQSRTYKAFFPTRKFISAIPSGDESPESRERGERIASHMNYQLGHKDRTYKANKNQMFMAVALHGSDFTKSYFSYLKQRTVVERVRALDLVVPYHIGPMRIEELDRKTQIKYQSVNDTRILEKLGFFLQSGTPYESGEVKESAPKDVIEEQQGMIEISGYGMQERPALILEQHCLLDLDEDGIAEPYIVWVDEASRKVLRIQIRYEVDEFGRPVKDKDPIEYFTHYQFMPNPDGFYGLGLGHLLGKLNKAINKLSRMFIDGTELSTIGNLTYLISDQLGLPGDEFELSIGRGIKIPRSVDDIRRHFMKLDFQSPGPELAGMIQQLIEAAQRISSSSDILAGQPDKVYQPHALLTMLDQGLQLFSSVQEFLGYAMEDELNKIYRLNATHMVNEEHFVFEKQHLTITPEDYQDDFIVRPIFDPKQTTRGQKLAKSQAVREFALTDPIAQQNSQTIWLAGRQYLESLDVDNLDEFYPEPAVPEVARIDDQNLENSYFLMPPDKRPLFDVFPDQDHMKHIQTIDEFIASFLDQGEAMEIPMPEAEQTPITTQGDPAVRRIVQSMSNEQKEELLANLLRHRSQHLSYMYGQLNGVMDENGNPIGQGSDTGMAGAAGNDGDLAVVESLLQAIS